MKKIIFVIWVDSSSHNCGWTYNTNIDMVYIDSIGILIHEDDKKIIISHSLSKNEIGELKYDLFVIPKGAIQYMATINNLKELNKLPMKKMKLIDKTMKK